MTYLSRAELSQTTQRLLTSETSFNLAFETEAVIFIEFGFPSLKIEEYNKDTSLVWLHANLDLIEESRECIAVRMAAYQQQVARYYNSQIKPKKFQAGDLVLCRAKVSQLIE